jgi:general secretion pathway protein A
MYLDFYGLTESPFNLTPDTSFLYPSRVHREVLAHLLYGVNSRKGFIMVTGEVGSGKTTLCRALVTKLGPNTEVALVLNSFLSELELLRTINEELGIQSTGSTRKELIDELNDFLLDQRMREKNVVLIIDEAQNLSFPVMEQIRMLSNLETEKEKLLQIVLVGQPELRRMLASPRLRQLNQRITVRHHITPLTAKESIQYIYHRLRVAGSSGNIVFTAAALDEIYRFSGGIPRMMNVVCDQALLAGYVANATKIDRKMIQAAEKEIEGGGKRPFVPVRRRFSIVQVGAVVGLVAAAFLIVSSLLGPTIRQALFPGKTARSDTTAPGGQSVAAKVGRLSGQRLASGTPLLESAEAAHPGQAAKGASPSEKAAGPDEGRIGGAGQPGEGTPTARKGQEETPVESGRADAVPAAPDVETSSDVPPTPSLMRLAFLAGATSRVGQTLRCTLSPEMEPLFSEGKAVLAAAPPAPKVKLPEPSSVSKASDRRVLAYRSFVEPMFTVLRLWKRTPAAIGAVRQRYAEVGGHFRSLVTAADMGWATFGADLQTLRMVDMPAIIEVVGETEEQKGYVALVAMGETWADVATAAGTKRLDIQLLSEILSGNAIVLCDDGFVDPEPLRQGQGISLNVRKLQDYMKGAGYFKGNPSGWFTPETTAAIMAFQRDQGLPASGEADARTKLLLYASQGKAAVPRLCITER